MKRIQYLIKPDGTVEERPLEGFEGNECHEATQAIEQALGIVQGSEPTEGAFRAPTVRMDTHQKR